MPVTQLNGSQVKDSSIQNDDIDITTTGKAVVTKLVAGTNISLSSTGVDAGTGVVTINSSGGGSSLPTQTGYSGYFLSTDGTDPVWANVAASFALTYNTPTNMQYMYYSTTNGWTAFTITNYADQAAASGVASGVIYSVTDGGGNKQLFIK